MTDEEIQRIREKYRNPKNLERGIETVANVLVDEIVRQDKDIKIKECKPMAEKKVSRIAELENVLLDQIEKLNDDSIMEEPEKAKALIERSQAMSSLSKNIVEIQQLKLNVIKACEHNGGIYDKYLGIE
jgi:uncharacterized protein YkvS